MAHVALLQNSAGHTLRGPQLRGAKNNGKFAPQSFGPLILRPAEFWTPQSVPRQVLDPSNCAPQSFGAMQSVPRFLMET